MSEENQQPRRCLDCNYVFQSSDIGSKSGLPKTTCPKCGSPKILISMVINDTVNIYGYIGMQKKSKDSKHRHKIDVESAQGITTGTNGELVFKKTLKDREKLDTLGSYMEYVRDHDGKIKEKKIEKLSEHTSKPRDKHI
jgi:hypothetical protein